jgi:deoxyribodipyrimidine photolyase-related protein
MLRHLVLVLGDQLDAASAAFDGFDLARDAILQTQVSEEAIYIRQHKRRLAFFFAAMRHFRDEQRAAGRQVFYSELDDPANRGSFAAEVRRRAAELTRKHWNGDRERAARQPLPVSTVAGVDEIEAPG